MDEIYIYIYLIYAEAAGTGWPCQDEREGNLKRVDMGRCRPD